MRETSCMNHVIKFKVLWSEGGPILYIIATNQSSNKHIPNHKMEVLLGKVLLDVVPGLCDEIDGETVHNTNPREQGLLHPPLQQVGQDEDGRYQTYTDASCILEKCVSTQFGS